VNYAFGKDLTIDIECENVGYMLHVSIKQISNAHTHTFGYEFQAGVN